MKLENLDINKLISLRKEFWDKRQRDEQGLEKDRQFRTAVANHIISDKDGASNLRKELKENPALIIELMFVIVDKRQKTVPFFINAVQEEFLATIESAVKDFEAGVRNHLKFLVLKGRQQGFTSIITAYQMAHALLKKNFAGITLADNAENTESIFSDRAKFIYDHIPGVLQPTEKYNNRREFVFQKPDGTGLNSRWRVATAGNRDVGRSQTLSFLHGSEAAFWDGLQPVLVGLQEALTANCIAVLESTANGHNAFKELWDGDNNWEPLFYAWWLTPEYELGFETGQREEEFRKRVTDVDELYTPEEQKAVHNKAWVYSRCKWLREKKGLNWKQLYWYYNKWVDKRESVKQEYPCMAEEAFLASGRPYFDVEAVSRRLLDIREPIYRGYYTYEYDLDEYTKSKKIIDESIRWNESPYGNIAIYRLPREDGGYVMGGDTATEGIDRNVAQVLDITGQQVATLTIESDEDYFADQEYCLGRYFNWAMIGNEVNHSTHPTRVLVEREYPNMYVRGQSPDSISGSLQKKYGVRTMQGNRSTMLGELKTLVRDETNKINDQNTLKEMLSFVVNERNKPEAEEGAHDDYIMSLAIALYIKEREDDTEHDPVGEITGYFTQEELEDLGYSRFEIRRYMEDRRLWRT